MRSALRLLGTRYGMALLLLLILVAVVGIARAVSGTNRGGLFDGAAVPAPHSSVAADTQNDGVSTQESPPGPVTSSGAAPPADLAASFARAWLAHTGVTGDQWRNGMAAYATPGLMAKFQQTDPAMVPASRITGPVSLRSYGAAIVDATVPLDSGTLVLRLLGPGGRWLVDGVSWDRP